MRIINSLLGTMGIFMMCGLHHEDNQNPNMEDFKNHFGLIFKDEENLKDEFEGNIVIGVDDPSKKFFLIDSLNQIANNNDELNYLYFLVASENIIDDYRDKYKVVDLRAEGGSR